jgi:uncharacterized peroxidase-related enzyme
MTWIKTISYEQATGRLKKIYDRLKGPEDKIDNILAAHSLRPHTLEGHMALYKYVLHHSANKLDKSFLETIGVYVSLLNQCSYCVDHHFSGLKRLINDDVFADKIYTALESRSPDKAFGSKQALMLNYAEKLTLRAAEVTEVDLESLREVGYGDGEILEVNQVTAYFNYANRTVLGLGVTTEGDILGLSPNNSDNSNDWSHK